MMLRRLKIGAIALLFSASALAQDSWIVRDFRVEGAQWIPIGTVFNYLTINIGDEVDALTLREAFRALYSEGFFENLEFRRDGDTLVIAVQERPRIVEFTFDGNRDIEDEQLEEALRGAGLSTGKTLDRSLLTELRQFLTEEYHGRGKYAAQVETVVEQLEENTVRVAIEIKEGDRSEIRQINIVGNTIFSDEELLEQFQLTTGGGLFSFMKDDNLYSKQALEGDLERLQSYYMDRGYADFRIEAPLVRISPDKRDMFITVMIDEGELYTVSEIDLVGTYPLTEAQMRQLIFAQPGQIFSQNVLALSEENITYTLGDMGYSFATINASSELDRETNEVRVRFFVDQNNRVYVRNVAFEGATSINDDVFRREVRQLEGAYMSNVLVGLSNQRIQQLPYVEAVDYETVPVPGTNDLVDVNFMVEEGLPGQFGGSIGFSESQGVVIGGNFTHSNFMGTGNRVSANIRGGDYYTVYDMSFTDRYRNIDGLSRQISFSYQDIKQYTSASSEFSTQTINAGMTWGYPVAEFQRVQLGFAARKSELLTSIFSSSQAVQWVRQNGEFFEVPLSGAIGTKIDSVDLIAGYSFESLNRAIFPDSGAEVGITFTATYPGSEVEYYLVRLGMQKFFRLPGRWRFRVNSEVAFGDAYGETTALPPYRQFYGGGPASVRGFKESRLGPRDSRGNPYGGNMLVTNQFELLIPTSENMSRSMRIALFVDAGNVFHTGGVDFFDRLGDPVSYDFDYDDLKTSAGISVEWLAPAMGLLKFSLAKPFNSDETTDRFWGDDDETFQFTVGNAF